MSDKTYLYATRITLIIAMINTMLPIRYLVVRSGEFHWVFRVIAAILFFLVIAILFHLNAANKLSRFHTAWLAPSFMMLAQVAFSVFADGDSIHFWILLLCSLMSLSYLNKRALLLYIALSNIMVLVPLYLLQMTILLPGTSLMISTMQFLAYNVANAILYSICSFSVGSKNQYEATSRMFHTVLKTSPGYLVVIDNYARVEYISQSMAEWLGISAAKHAINRPILDLCKYFELKMMFQQTIKSGSSMEETYELVFEDKRHWLMMRSELINDKGIARIFEITDISPIMEAKNEAEMATKAKGDFLANMSHEIRTPMNAIVGMTELLMLKTLDAEQLFQAVSIKGASMSLLQIINDILDLSKIDSNKMEIIVKPFDFMSLINDTINMIGIKACTEGITFVANISKDIPPIINSDELRIKQCLVNILNNAVKFTKEGCVSLSSWSEFMEDGTVKLHFSVKDTGMGIKAEDMEKLFGEYQQLDTRKNRLITGTGLGLAITRNFIELMGGRIKVESTYGKGSVFSFYVICEGEHKGSLAPLPTPEKYKALFYEFNPYHMDSIQDIFSSLRVHCHVTDNIADFEQYVSDGDFTHIFFDCSAEPLVSEYTTQKDARFILTKDVTDIGSAAYPSHFINRPVLITNVARILDGQNWTADDVSDGEDIKLGDFKTKDVKILLVDDQPANLTVAEGMLRQYSITVVTAMGGQEAVDAAQAADFDIIFMDHMMPGMDGIDATQAIRALGGDLSYVPIIALTANAVSGARDMFLAAGMNDFLSKPIIIKDLHTMLLKHIPPGKVIERVPTS